ncbi:hypothetical protein E8L99_16090 [Phreatobacter aquaticus]|uniref:DUF3313 domain-containing protein n=1 Tax=Phreatobacter aquaticus TaxID=2570229 RepID=A0A4D7QKN1_9HYPH|nr:hypothetical protein [Phreatobacter aquaticus]QCK87171.1 hypothetical protein E8L99_16090 [Phreatobacter aquaticus]
MRVRYLAALAPLMLAGCQTAGLQGAGDRPDNTRVRDAVLSSVAAALGSGSEVSLAFPRVTNLHPGDVFERPMKRDGYVTFQLQRRLCNLGEELGDGVKTEVVHATSVMTVNRVFSASAHLKFDLAKIASFSLGDATTPIHAAHVRVSNGEAVGLTSAVRDTMYPTDGACARRIARSVAAGREVAVIDLVYNAAVYTRVAWTAQAGVKLTSALGVIGGLDAGINIQDTDVYGQETGDNRTMLGVAYRRIRSVEEARRR